MNGIQRVLKEYGMDSDTESEIYRALYRVNSSISMEPDLNRVNGLRFACQIARKYQNPSEVLIFLEGVLEKAIDQEKDAVGLLGRIVNQRDPIRFLLESRADGGRK